MSKRFPVCTGNEVIRVLRANGFVMLSQRGSHQKVQQALGLQPDFPRGRYREVNPKGVDGLPPLAHEEDAEKLRF